MNSPSIQHADAYFRQHLATSFDALMQAVEGDAPAGPSLRYSGVYHAIDQARRADDASLPMGSWNHELKRADWRKVDTLAVNALTAQSKDLQLVGWLLEAQIHQTGFSGIAPCITLMHALCDRYWTELHPQADGDDLEYRANVVRWINDKMLTALRLVPITVTGRGRDYCWSDWEQAHRNEQLRAAVGSRDASSIEGVTTSELMAGFAMTTTEIYLALYHTLEQALAAIADFTMMLDERLGAESPSLGAMSDVLENVFLFTDSELHKRGAQPVAIEEKPTGDIDAATAPTTIFEQEDGSQPLRVGPVRDRADAYARLAEAADFLMRLEPHSPVPYLIRRATEWGNLNTVELYQELFLKLGGQLNIFEMLGLQSTTDVKN